MSLSADDLATRAIDAVLTGAAGVTNQRDPSALPAAHIRQDASPAESTCDPITDHPFTD